MVDYIFVLELRHVMLVSNLHVKELLEQEIFTTLGDLILPLYFIVSFCPVNVALKLFLKFANNLRLLKKRVDLKQLDR